MNTAFSYARFFAVSSLLASLVYADPTLLMWYEHPASELKPITEALPIGNGRMGALVVGNPARERLILSEDSLWSGDQQKMGSYQFFGDAVIHLPDHQNTSNYHRGLDLSKALVKVSYDSNGVHYEREFFCSHPDDLLVARFSASQAEAYHGSVELIDSHQASYVLAGHNKIIASGTLENGRKFEWQILLINEGGSIVPISLENSVRLDFKNCDALRILIACGTDYKPDFESKYTGEAPHYRLNQQINHASTTRYVSLKEAHLADYRALFGRVNLNLGSSSIIQRALPTDKRKLQAFHSPDPEFERLFFQYGRYLLIASSRPGGLPANLQGLWNYRNNPAWNSDYHTNINVQMNYWPAEITNLSECHTPFFDLIKSQLPSWRELTATAREFYDSEGKPNSVGFALRTSHNITGGMGWKWNKTANAWYCQHLWEHYAFNQNEDFLREVAYPIMKETCQFWDRQLKPLTNGRLVVPKDWSPEHGPVEDGISHSQQIVYDLFTHYIQAADILKLDNEFRDHVAQLKNKLLAPSIGSWGQLKEWMHEKSPRSFKPKTDFKKTAASLIERLIKADSSTDPVAHFVWHSFNPQHQNRLQQSPSDTSALFEGLNKLIQWSSLARESCLAKHLQNPVFTNLDLLSAKDPSLLPLLNHCLLIEGLGLDDKREVNALDSPSDRHRHTSHLFAVFPGQQISIHKTPELAEAAKVSLDARGIKPQSDVREWSFAWRAALYARLQDPDKAYQMLQQLFSQRNTCPNLFGLHPPMQIDGNFGATAAIAEMLLQSHEDTLEFLPALPKAWKNGSATGLRARGNLTVNLHWEDSKVTHYEVLSPNQKKLSVRINGEVHHIVTH
ncbi:MAG: Uncharacterised protein [Opitutia bacterium UBA7350]|nr:MAG: Uncharacterised protein [Opitutae bacterium UBA7350]